MTDQIKGSEVETLGALYRALTMFESSIEPDDSIPTRAHNRTVSGRALRKSSGLGRSHSKNGRCIVANF